MIYSMTGYGKTVIKLPLRDMTIEIKSLNSKQLDLSLRAPAAYSGIESLIRSEIAKYVVRGKVDITIYTENAKGGNSPSINIPVLQNYKQQIEKAAEELNIEQPSDWFKLLLRLPDSITTEACPASENEDAEIMKGVAEAIKNLVIFRQQEGAMLQKLFTQKIKNIANLLDSVEPFEKERIEKIKGRITDSLENLKSVDYDKNRLEQEIIFYIEKLDINEEKHRLDNHLKYFMETMECGEGQGKKLGFIAQEMGREINTLGSKANNAEMQRIVVQMKDELEQIKEQVLNVL
ncbi:MAG: YicC/YloC family endoribonuclease [Bacteroidales bacterium]